MEKAHFGMIGLGTMGRNFLLNIAEHGISGVGYDLDESKRKLLLDEGAGMPVDAGATLEEFLAKLESPRNIMLLVPAGPIVDSVIAQLAPQLDSDDLIIDGGNSHFVDTERREAMLSERGIGFMGIGVSGGEAGARHGASIMPGGQRAYYDRVEKTLQAVAAKVGDDPCVAYMGTGSAGHFVKMVHNGIEYGLMQILAETFDFMLRVLKMSYREMSETFARWNDSELNSFLVEITAEVLRKRDAETGQPLVEMILDKAAQKGTGKWTSQAAMDLGVPIPTIDSAVSMRQISAQKETRVLIARKFSSEFQPSREQTITDGETATSQELHGQKADLARADVETVVSEHLDGRMVMGQPSETLPADARTADAQRHFDTDTENALEQLRRTLLSSFIITYAQGLSLLQAASIEKNYGLDLSEIARIWRGGCIIRSALLDEMRAAYGRDAGLPNLMLDDRFARILSENCGDWHEIIGKFSASRVPTMCLSSALEYFEAFRSDRLPANLIQAQRDYFGAHTYQRVDREGIFHTPDWDNHT
jgi:6-phosphogluconate dehydrogenase